MLGEYGIYGQIRAILTAMFNSLMPSLNSRSLPFVVFLGGFPSRCQNLSSGAIRPGGLLQTTFDHIKLCMVRPCKLIISCSSLTEPLKSIEKAAESKLIMDDFKIINDYCAQMTNVHSTQFLCEEQMNEYTLAPQLLTSSLAFYCAASQESISLILE